MVRIAGLEAFTRSTLMGEPQKRCATVCTLNSVTPTDSLWDYADDLQRYASHMCRHREDAEDVAQNALMKAAQKIDGFRGEASVRTWLHTIATNECRMLRRKVAPGPFDEALEAALAADQKAVPYGPQQSPESLAIEADSRREVVAALAQLPERYSQVVVLKDGCGLRAAEVARVLDTTIPAVKSVLFRARRMLRDQLGPLEPLV